MKLLNLVPMLNVSDIEKSLDFYQTALGFEVVSDPAAVRDWRWATIRSGHTELMLSETGHAAAPKEFKDPHQESNWPVIFYFYPDDVVRLYAHVIAAGYEPTALKVTHYDMREFSLVDPDGHVLSFGQDSKQLQNGNRYEAAMHAEIKSAVGAAEFETDERCHIQEIANDAGDELVSIARARVEPGITTAWHSLDGITERYIIVSGRGRVDIDRLQPVDVEVGDVVRIPADSPQRITNTGMEDLVFYAVCAPPFQQDRYVNLE